jgi:hypothetical protein
VNVGTGHWYSFPKAGACPAEQEEEQAAKSKSDGGCTWRRDPTARNLYGSALLAHGWDRSSSFDDKTGRYKNTTLRTLNNAEALQKAFDSLDELVTKRCCGC